MNKVITSIRLRRILNLVLTVILCMSVAFSNEVVAFAENDETNVETGTQQNAKDRKNDPDDDISEEVENIIPNEWEEIEIYTVEDLYDLAKKCSLDTWSRNKYVILKDNISLNDSDFLTIPTFGGVFDGQNHKISFYNVECAQSQIGLFANVQKQGVIKNLNVTGKIVPIGSQAIIGGIAGDNNGIIMGCTFVGVVQAKDYVGGIAGINRLDGIISDCKVEGIIMGTHCVGGITGENMGNIIRTNNRAEINTTEQEMNINIENIDIDSYIQKFSLNHDETETDTTAGVDDITDVGGIAGMSIGVIQNCVNDGTVGYEKIGYNVGGIVGRQSGYVYGCQNKGSVLGRKDVGGIVGQAEPYVTIDFTQDIVYQLSENINKLHDVIAVTLNDVDGSSDTISSRLAIIQQFTNGAIMDTDYLASSSVDWVDGMVGSANEFIGRADYIMQETAKQEGVLDQAKNGTNNLITAGSQIATTLSMLEVYQYMTPDQQLQYGEYQKTLDEINKEYAEYLSNATVAYTNYYLDDIRHSTDYLEKDGITHTNYWSDTPNESDLSPKNGDYSTIYSAIKSEYDPMIKQKKIYDNYSSVNEWVHAGDSPFPDPNDGPQRELDNKLQNAVANSADSISRDAQNCADNLYYANHLSAYNTDVLNLMVKMTNILNSENVRGQMSDNVKAEVDSTIGYMNSAKGNFDSAINQSKDIYNDILNRGSITLPKLGEEYKAHTTSLNNNLQGMADNFGYLNQEINGSTDALVTDLSAVNDQFNVIMMLYTDAIDGVLDNDYSNTIEDNSLEVAEVCTDATISDCINMGYVYGALDIAGIAGTMAIEYDYDLESDVTGIKDANLNTTYLTKCVLRNNTNKGIIKAEKSFVSGVCGLQEMGTIYKCSNYEKIVSVSGEYVGGIAGSSLSDIVNSYAKSILEGKAYVGGIAGKINNASDCYSWVSINNAVDYYGAVAGDITSDGRIRGNMFVSDCLAGINRISYSLKAEPISVDSLLEQENVPQEFSELRIVFLLDDGEDNIIPVGEEYVSYGDFLNVEDYPSIEEKEGFYVSWDTQNINIYNDMEIVATYVRNLTTLASEELRASNQSAILVDGSFQTDDRLSAYLSKVSSDMLDNVLEYWELEIPCDGNETHVVRYSLPDDADIKPEDISVYYRTDDEWMKVDELGMMGKYYTFEVPGNNVNIQIVNETNKINLKRIVICAFIVIATIGGLAGIITLIRSKKTKMKSKNKK